MAIDTRASLGFSPARLQRISDGIRRFVDGGVIPGAVSLLLRRGAVVHAEATGVMDCESGEPMTADGIFRLMSMTKPITVVAALILFEEGRFLLDDPVARFLPEFDGATVFASEKDGRIEVVEPERPISIRHLMTHTSGLTYPLYALYQHPVARCYEEAQIGRLDESLADKVLRLAALPLVFQPGTAWMYGVSHDVLGRLVEVITGQSLDVVLRERLFAPLEMPDTGFAIPLAKLHRLAPAHRSDGNGRVQRVGDDSDRSRSPVFLSGGGGLVSTAVDYVRFCQMLLNGGELDGVRILGRKTVELMTANHWTRTASPYPPGFPVLGGYGYGLGVRTMLDVTRCSVLSSPGEYGWAGSLGTHFWIDPREELIGVFMTQMQPANYRPGWMFQQLAYQALI